MPWCEEGPSGHLPPGCARLGPRTACGDRLSTSPSSVWEWRERSQGGRVGGGGPGRPPAWRGPGPACRAHVRCATSPLPSIVPPTSTGPRCPRLQRHVGAGASALPGCRHTPEQGTATAGLGAGDWGCLPSWGSDPKTEPRVSICAGGVSPVGARKWPRVEQGPGARGAGSWGRSGVGSAGGRLRPGASWLGAGVGLPPGAWWPPPTVVLCPPGLATRPCHPPPGSAMSSRLAVGSAAGRH